MVTPTPTSAVMFHSSIIESVRCALTGSHRSAQFSSASFPSQVGRSRGWKTQAWQARSIVIFVSLLCLAWIVLGLVGHDPWKPDEAYSFGLVLSILEGHDWVVPMLAREPFMEKPPVYYLTAALTAKAFSAMLPLHDAARLATGLYMALTFLVVGLTGRELFGRRQGWVAPLMLVSSAGLLLWGHLLLTDIAQLTGFALAFYGLALGMRRPYVGGAWLGTGVGLAFMSKGLLALGCFGILVALLPVLSDRWRSRDYARSLLAACLASLPWLVIWPAMLYERSPQLFMVWFWDNNFGRFLGRNTLGPNSEPFYILVTLVWSALPAWPLALSAVWRARRDIAGRPELMLPLAECAVLFGVLSLSRQGRDVYVLPLLLPLSLLALPRLLSLGHDMTKAFSTIAIAVFLALALVVWILWAALDLSVPNTLHERLISFQPSYTPAVSLATLGFALALTAGWLWVVLRFPRIEARPAVMWLAGMTMVWGLASVFFIRYLDTGHSYRQMMFELRAHLPVDCQCMTSRNLGEPQRAMLHYFAGILTYREEQARSYTHRCDILLVQGFSSQMYQPDGQWERIWEGSRPGDRKELYRLYRRLDPDAASRAPAPKTSPAG
jgi:4-amino-4-deoxy-L-arabinose transferase-like glycosyltransferase